MAFYNSFACILCVTAVTGLQETDNEISSNVLHESRPVKTYSEVDRNLMTLQKASEEKVKLDVYYECLCPYCIRFYKRNLMPVMKKIGKHIILNTYPYGNAETIEKNGVLTFNCQHGPRECYGNKLHACALDILGKGSSGLKFTSCLMQAPQSRKNPRRILAGSDDATADKCGDAISVDAEPIKLCAKGDKGTELLKFYGEESKKANFNYVPYVVINGKENEDEELFGAVCSAFKNPPPECTKYII